MTWSKHSCNCNSSTLIRRAVPFLGIFRLLTSAWRGVSGSKPAAPLALWIMLLMVSMALSTPTSLAGAYNVRQYHFKSEDLSCVFSGLQIYSLHSLWLATCLAYKKGVITELIQFNHVKWNQKHSCANGANVCRLTQWFVHGPSVFASTFPSLDTMSAMECVPPLHKHRFLFTASYFVAYIINNSVLEFPLFFLRSAAAPEQSMWQC